MEKINITEGKRYYKNKDNVVDLKKNNNSYIKLNQKDYKLSKDRGDSNPIRNSKEKIESKNIQHVKLNSRVTDLSVPSKPVEKKDVNIQDSEKKGDKDKNSKTRNLLDRRYVTKSKNTLDTKDEINKDKRIKHKREVISPIRERHGVSPPTEIAKWAPNSITDHTKPYYEAWINTTLAAMCSKKDRLYLEKKKIWKTFQKSLEQRPFSPELVYENYADERFTGKIRVNHS
ncbi:uncharacterized protein LOC126780053 isoform X2 [Nymphalis io]|uniref:uncharacterized protein LOC126780053 isoform X2 n=1 Tax=Inachis io TaxID=171585 RepID=UPI00216A7340|nr:uncharacterized protein LOC126780053 isoform X2 [Nymphalis io]